MLLCTIMTMCLLFSCCPEHTLPARMARRLSAPIPCSSTIRLESSIGIALSSQMDIFLRCRSLRRACASPWIGLLCLPPPEPTLQGLDSRLHLRWPSIAPLPGQQAVRSWKRCVGSSSQPSPEYASGLSGRRISRPRSIAHASFCTIDAVTTCRSQRSHSSWEFIPSTSLGASDVPPESIG
jgi:hypothetical protein